MFMANPSHAVPESSRLGIVVERRQPRQWEQVANRAEHVPTYAVAPCRHRDLERENVELPVRHLPEHGIGLGRCVKNELASSHFGASELTSQPMLGIANRSFRLPPRHHELA